MSENIHMVSAQVPFLRQLGSLAYRIGLPVGLALLVFGQIVFSFSKFRLSVEHPAWIVWSILGASVAVTLLLGWRKVRIGVPDIFFGLFIAIFTISFVVVTNGQHIAFAKYLIFFAILPYLAGRLMDAGQLKLFAWASLALCILSLVIVGVEVALLPADALAADRIRLFADPGEFSTDGDPTSINVGIVSGGLIAIASLLLFRPNGPPLHWTAVAGLIVATGLAYGVLILAGSRSALIASVVVVVLGFCLGGFKRWGRMLLISAAIVSTSVTVLGTGTTSDSRVVLLSGGNTAGDEVAVRIDSLEEQGSCDRYGNSIATRIEYLKSALDLFMANPVLGIGTAQYGLLYCGEDKSMFVSPHNVVAQAFAENGMIGGLAFCAAALAALIAAFRKRNEMAFPAVTVFGFFAVVAFFSGSLFTSYDYYAALGLLSAAGGGGFWPKLKGAANAEASRLN